jgi:phage major head subunit gpT-like protein
MIFDDMAATYQEYDVRNDAAGLKLTRNQLEDNDGDGFDFAGEWSSQMGALMAYRPQEKITALIIAGATATALAYDKVQFFADNVVNSGNGHPVNQFKPGAGKYFNWFHGAASGVYPGALPIDESVSVDVALANLQKVIAYIASIKMPNGVTPRFLKPRRLAVPPRLVARAQQLTNARFIAQAAGASGGGSGDIEAIVSNWGFTQPLEVQEFAGVTLGDGASSDLTWYLVCEQVQSTQLGALVYVEREPLRIT